MAQFPVKYMPYLAVFIVLCAQLGRSTSVNSCQLKSGDSGILPEVNITSCDQQPCILYIGSNMGFTMRFQSPRYLEHIKPALVASVAGLDIPWAFLNQDDACEGVTNTPCPLAEDEIIEYAFSLSLDNFPEVSAVVAFSIVDLDDNNANVVCYKIAVQMKKP